MDKELLEKYINDGLSSWKISKLTGIGQTSVRYWLKKYRLKSIFADGGRPKKQNLCIICGETNPKNFYGNQKQCCKRCRGLEDLKKQQEKRKYAVDLLGGKCSNCGYSKYIGALDIHHIDPTTKYDKAFNYRSWSYEKITEECKNVFFCVQTVIEKFIGVPKLSD